MVNLVLSIPAAALLAYLNAHCTGSAISFSCLELYLSGTLAPVVTVLGSGFGTVRRGPSTVLRSRSPVHQGETGFSGPLIGAGCGVISEPKDLPHFLWPIPPDLGCWLPKEDKALHCQVRVLRQGSSLATYAQGIAGSQGQAGPESSSATDARGISGS
jgi:hypothetical protein